MSLDPKQFSDDRDKARLLTSVKFTREYILQEALRRSHPYYHVYRAFPRKYRIEDDIRACLDAFRPVGPDDAVTIYQLKHLRRIAFRRYAFGLAAQINSCLRAAGANSMWDRFWQVKDYFFPRIFFSLIIGFGVVLGAGRLTDWLGFLSLSRWKLFCISTLALGVVFSLVYLNVRDRLGNVPEVWPRAGLVFGACVAWLALALSLIAMAAHGIPVCFMWAQACVVGVTALVLAILGQFFFSEGKSIAEPL